MSKATLIPGIPAVTKVITVAPAVEPKVTIELTLEEAGKLKALAGHVWAGSSFGLFGTLDRLHGIHSYEATALNGGALPSITFASI